MLPGERIAIEHRTWKGLERKHTRRGKGKVGKCKFGEEKAGADIINTYFLPPKGTGQDLSPLPDLMRGDPTKNNEFRA